MTKKMIACALTMAFLGGAPVAATGAEGGSSTQGKSLYQEHCLPCHGEDGKGDGPMAPSFSTPPANFTNPQFWRNNPDQKITNAVQNGYRLMPPIGLAPEQTKEVIGYLSHAFKNQ